MGKILLFCIGALSASFLRAAASTSEYARAMETFHQYADGKRAGIKNDSNMPFLLTHGRKTSRSILMVHGYTDSPYYVRSLADEFYAQGYNVVAILLPGHGTKPEDLLRV